MRFWMSIALIAGAYFVRRLSNKGEKNLSPPGPQKNTPSQDPGLPSAFQILKHSRPTPISDADVVDVQSETTPDRMARDRTLH